MKVSERTVFAIGPTTGGVSDVFRRVRAELTSRGYVVTTEEIPVQNAAAWAGLRAIWRNRKRLRSSDVVHVEFGSNDHETFWFALGAVSLRSDVVLVVHDHPKIVNHPAAELVTRRSKLGRVAAYRILVPILDKALKSALLSRAGVVVGFSAEACAAFQRSGARRTVEITHGADNASEAGPPPSSASYILFAGFIGPGKGVDVLLDAWVQCGRQTDMPLVIAGAGGDDLDAMLGDLSRFASRPRVIGAVEQEKDFQRLIQEASIVVLPYRSSSPASGVFVRAFAAGRAVIATPVPAARTLESGVNGLTVPVGDSGALAAAITQLAADPGERDRLGAQAAVTAKRVFSWDKHLDGLEVAYREVGAEC